MGKGVNFAFIIGAIAVGLRFYFSKSVVLSPVVRIPDGELQGRQELSRGGRTYWAFLGIPFAEPPVGNLRFEAPVPVKPWVGVKSAVEYPPPCAQVDGCTTGRVSGVEDCLFVNVMTHDVKGKRPVIVNIHGGAFLAGSSKDYQPTYFMDEDIVIVSMQYRLGPLGFLNTGDELIRGNMGLKDQLLALKWVQKNIANFGGDPNQVTIIGISAGGASVHHHVLSPASANLFQRAVAQSGAASCPWAVMSNPKEKALSYGKSLGCPTDNSSGLVSCLKNLDPFDMGRPQLAFLDPVSGYQLLGPSVEAVQRSDSFFLENPRKILRSGKYPNKVPMIMGFTSGEGVIRTGRLEAMPEAIPELDQNWVEHLPGVLLHEKLSKEVASKIRTSYFGSEDLPFPREGSSEFFHNFTNMISDSGFGEPINRAATLHAAHGGEAYLYLFDYKATMFPAIKHVFQAVRPDDWLPGIPKVLWTAVVEWAKFNLFGIGESPHQFGVSHGEDGLQIWNHGVVSFNHEKDVEFSRRFVKLIVDFAYGKTLEFKGIRWPHLKKSTLSEADTPPYMVFSNDEAKVVLHPYKERVQFMESLKLPE